MDYVCGQGCKVELGMSKPAPTGTCKAHGRRYRYANELQRKEPLKRVSDARREQVRKAGSTFTGRSKGFEASPAQRAKVKGLPCIACGKEGTEDEAIVIDPAHLWPRGKGGCDHPDCVIPLCRLPFAGGEGCHRLLDEGQLDLLGRLEERDFHEAYAREIAHPIAEHGVSLVALVRRLTGSDWEFRRKEQVAHA